MKKDFDTSVINVMVHNELQFMLPKNCDFTEAYDICLEEILKRLVTRHMFKEELPMYVHRVCETIVREIYNDKLKDKQNLIRKNRNNSQKKLIQVLEFISLFPNKEKVSTAIELVMSGHMVKDIAQTLNVSTSTVYDYIKSALETYEEYKSKYGSHKKVINQAAHEVLESKKIEEQRRLEQKRKMKEQEQKKLEQEQKKILRAKRSTLPDGTSKNRQKQVQSTDPSKTAGFGDIDIYAKTPVKSQNATSRLTYLYENDHDLIEDMISEGLKNGIPQSIIALLELQYEGKLEDISKILTEFNTEDIETISKELREMFLNKSGYFSDEHKAWSLSDVSNMPIQESLKILDIIINNNKLSTNERNLIKKSIKNKTINPNNDTDKFIEKIIVNYLNGTGQFSKPNIYARSVKNPNPSYIDAKFKDSEIRRKAKPFPEDLTASTINELIKIISKFNLDEKDFEELLQNCLVFVVENYYTFDEQLSEYSTWLNMIAQKINKKSAKAFNDNTESITNIPPIRIERNGQVQYGEHASVSDTPQEAIVQDVLHDVSPVEQMIIDGYSVEEISKTLSIDEKEIVISYVCLKKKIYDKLNAKKPSQTNENLIYSLDAVDYFRSKNDESSQRYAYLIAFYEYGLTLEQISQKFGITRERVRQVIKDGLKIYLRHSKIRTKQLELAELGIIELETDVEKLSGLTDD